MSFLVFIFDKMLTSSAKSGVCSISRILYQFTPALIEFLSNTMKSRHKTAKIRTIEHTPDENDIFTRIRFINK